MSDCHKGISIPILPTDPCNGKTFSSKCIIHSDILTLLDLPANSDLQLVINTLIVSLTTARLADRT